jgi:uncharacterized protein (UPF0261 family)
VAKSIVIVGTLDTKGDQVKYLKELIERHGHKALVVDVGVIGPVPFEPGVTREQVAQASGSTLRDIIALNAPGSALMQMAKGVSTIIKDLDSAGRLDGFVAVGGSGGTSLALTAIKAIPLKIPKLIVTTMAYSAAITPDMVSGDNVMMLPWVGGLWGLNSISKGVLEMAAGTICGAAEVYDRTRTGSGKVIGVTSLGASVNRYLKDLKPALEERGFEVAVFHVTGMSGRMYERTITDGLIDVSLDLSVGVELLNSLTGGVCSAGPDRLEAAGKMGIPQIVSPGATEAFHWGADRPFPAKYRTRPSHRHNALLLTVASSPRETSAVGALTAEKLNRATGPAAVVIPMKGVGDPPKAPPVKPKSGSAQQVAAFREALMRLTPSCMKAFRTGLMKHIKPEVEVVELDAGFNEPVFLDTVLRLFDEMTRSVRPG